MTVPANRSFFLTVKKESCTAGFPISITCKISLDFIVIGIIIKNKMFKQGEIVMPKAKYTHIYKDLKEKIETEAYSYQEMLPSENTLVLEYDCSRNTVRRAISELTADGYVQPLHGKGVRNIFRPVEQAAFTVGGIESFKESSVRTKREGSTQVLQFAEIPADEKIDKRQDSKKEPCSIISRGSAF